MVRQGCGVRRGGQWYVTPTMLREEFPELYGELVPDLIEGENKGKR